MKNTIFKDLGISALIVAGLYLALFSDIGGSAPTQINCGSQVQAGTCTNTQISASAAIEESKISFATSTGHNHDGTAGNGHTVPLIQNATNSIYYDSTEAESWGAWIISNGITAYRTSYPSSILMSNDLWEGSLVGTGLVGRNTAITSDLFLLYGIESGGQLRGNLWLGNTSGASSTIRLYDGTNYGTIIAGTLGGNYTWTMPAADGTIALTSGLSSYVLKAGDTMTGALIVNNDITATGTISAADTNFASATVNGPLHVTGKLTADGVIDPTRIVLHDNSASATVEITQDGAGRDIQGTSSSWYITKTGDMTAAKYYGDGSGLSGISATAPLSDVLSVGNSAGTYDIDMNNNSILNVSTIEGTSTNTIAFGSSAYGQGWTSDSNYLRLYNSTYPTAYLFSANLPFGAMGGLIVTDGIAVNDPSLMLYSIPSQHTAVLQLGSSDVSATGSIQLIGLNGSTFRRATVNPSTSMAGDITLTLPSTSGTLATTSSLSSYVAKSGDTMTGALTINNNFTATGTASFAGGYSSTGVDIATDGDITTSGQIRIGTDSLSTTGLSINGNNYDSAIGIDSTSLTASGYSRFYITQKNDQQIMYLYSDSATSTVQLFEVGGGSDNLIATFWGKTGSVDAYGNGNLTASGSITSSGEIRSDVGFNVNGSAGVASDCFDGGGTEAHLTITGGIVTAVTAGACP